MKQYKCIFFDLDHTLWDYEKNSYHTLEELFASYGLNSLGVTDLDSFHKQFRKVNTELWDLYDTGKITSEIIRKERFKQILEHFTIFDTELCETLSVDYLHSCPKKGHLVPHAIDTLNYLADKYSMTVVTNGFDEIQNVKLTAGNLHDYFDHIITSQKAGHRKPARGIFDYAMKLNGVQSDEVIMIGDNLITDIGGAINASIDTVFYNPENISHKISVSHEINSLHELRGIL
jgi:YjjG family noncanonical pyrimidine nucleotidase